MLVNGKTLSGLKANSGKYLGRIIGAGSYLKPIDEVDLMIALIPARGGSKGVPRKNIAQLNGRPLISHTIEAARGDHRLQSVVVSSDSDEILSISRQHGAIALVRPAEFSTDDASMLCVMQHAVHSFSASLQAGIHVNACLVLLQPTSPLRGAKHVSEAIDIFYRTRARALISVVSEDSKCLKNFISDSKGFIRGIANDQYPFMRRQDLPPVLRPNGAIYIYRFEDILNGILLPEGTIGYQMSDEVSIDIDSVEDFVEAERLFSEKGKST